jgi:hypothetical protein
MLRTTGMPASDILYSPIILRWLHSSDCSGNLEKTNFLIGADSCERKFSNMQQLFRVVILATTKHSRLY